MCVAVGRYHPWSGLVLTTSVALPGSVTRDTERTWYQVITGKLQVPGTVLVLYDTTYNIGHYILGLYLADQLFLDRSEIKNASSSSVRCRT